MRNIALVLEYDGTLFHGWQAQINAPTVHGAVSEAVRKLDGAPRRLIGASRTDAGVHARGQVANFHTDSRIPADKYAFALNTALPEGVVCVESYEAAPDFHARFSAVSKKYSYLILNRRQPSALHRNRAWHVPIELDEAAMRGAARLFIGEKDFRALMSAGSPVKSTIRTVLSLELGVTPAGGGGSFIKFEIEANGFLYNMARIIAGTLVYAGMGRLSAADIGRALASGDRKSAGKTAPPQGLCLEYIKYK